jgi:nucleoside-diphosphate-sugar epimerase
VAAKVLITGATGLIGTHVVRQWDLAEFELILVTRRVDDLLSPGVPTALLRQHRPAVVIHLAWSASGTTEYRSSPDNQRWVSASLELQHECERENVWLIATGTSLDDNLAPLDAYSAAKCELKGQLQPAISNQTMTWVQPFYVIDTTLRRPALVAQSLAARDRGEVMTLRDPEAAHDFVFAADVARAMIDGVRWGLRGELPIGSGRSRRVRDVVEALGVAWVPAEDRALNSADPHNHNAADISRLEDVGWSPVLTNSFFNDR